MKSLGLLEILIPPNPFLDLVRNNMSAIVLFLIMYGIAVQRISDKETFLSLQGVVRTTTVTSWHLVVLIAPFGIFALFADTAVTIEPAMLTDFSQYLVTMIFGTLILAFWLLPSIMVALCPLSK